MDRRAFLRGSAQGAAISLALNAGIGSFASAKAKPQIGTFGFDLKGMDKSIKPGDDFFEYAGGTWMKNNQIPNDRSRWGVFDQLQEKSQKDVKAIIEEMSSKKSANGTIEQKIGDYWRAYMNTEAINANGIKPLKPELDAIAAIKTHDDVAKLIASPTAAVNGPIAWGITIDDANPDRYIVGIRHSGLGLPERDYYLKDDDRMKDLRAKYPVFISKMLSLAGATDSDAKAKSIMDLETEIAKLHWPIADRRDSTKTYNPRKRSELETIAPDYPWTVAFTEYGINDVQEVIISEITAIEPLAKLFRATPVDIWKDYLTFHLLSNEAALLPKEFDDAQFDFYGKTLSGQKVQRERWKRATGAINGTLGEAIGQIYVKRHFSPNAKKQMEVLVENLRKAFMMRINNLVWMSAETKVEAKKKLGTFNPKIGYPNKWRDYSALTITAEDPIANDRRAMMFEHERDIKRLSEKTDRDEWFMTPQTVNAYYNPAYNEIVFPAAILQAPFFDENADPAINYGGIGGVIGHEMGHGFDDQGAKYDYKGVLHDWWKPSDVAAFNKLGDKMVEQYSGFEPLPGVHVNGRLTLGENIGDHCGITMGMVAYKLSLAGKEAPVLDGLTGEQRFFLSWAQVWRSLSREEALRNQVQTDPHSPARFRVNGTIQNSDAWYAAFNVQPGDKYYVAPENRVHIW